MKNSIKTFVILLLLVIVSCTTQNSAPKANITTLLQNNEFTFFAEHANPTGFEVANVANKLPNAGVSQLLNLDPGYTIQIKKDNLEVTLPYFGRMYTPSMDPDKNSYRFTSTDYQLTKEQGKRGSFLYKIVPNDQRNIRSIMIQIYNNGKAYVTISANDRSTISYDGYIDANLPTK